MEQASSLKIRAETVADYPAIAAVNLAAFGRVQESMVVALLRQSEDFDSELSLVLEIEGKVVGHVLFVPRRIQISGQFVRVVNLAPIAILPEHQKQGFGKKLIEAGHSLAREKGYDFSFLVGHPTYYPQLGYLQNAYGESHLHLSFDPEQLDQALSQLVTRPLKEKDMPELYKLWQSNVTPGVDFSLDPGQALIEWISTDPNIEALVYVNEAGEITGYTRARITTLEKPVMFLAKDKTVAQDIMRLLARRVALENPTSSIVEFELPLHPLSRLASELPGQMHSQTGEHQMVYPLRPSIFDQYYTQLTAGTRPPGFLIWPTAFDVT